MTNLELLSPARTADIGIEAIRHGADAVYIGAPRFGARAAAGNSIEDISRLTRYAHLFGAKVYVTVNTLLRNDELHEVEVLIRQLYDIHVDALIVQDLRLLTLQLPPIAMHASTQMDNRTPEHVKHLHDIGFRQVVLARELTIDQIRDIHQSCPDMKIECFVHGALCVSLSGRCYASQCLFGRSANRGECAQVCRMEFDLIEEQMQDGKTTEHTLLSGKHLLSLKDLCLIQHLKEMIDAGVTSFKIEGRLKDMSYVKNVTAAYSTELNKIIANNPTLYQRASAGNVELTFTPDIHKSFNRGFTTYFLHGRTPEIFSFDTPKALGKEVGTVKDVFTTCFTVAGLQHFANGDGLCFFDKGGRLQGFRLNKVTDGRLYPLDMPRQLRPKMRLYRNFDKQFDDLLERNSATRYIPVDMTLSETAQGFRLTMSDDYGHETHYEAQCEKQLAHTHQQDNIQRQLSKLGDTIYRLRTLSIDTNKNWFIPASWLSLWKRELVNTMPPFAPNTTNDTQPTAMPTTSKLAIEAEAELTTKAEAEASNDTSSPLMTCRHCIKYSLGMCKQPTPPWHLKMANGQRFRLAFDCRQCIMYVMKVLIVAMLLCSCNGQSAGEFNATRDSSATNPLYTDTLLELTQAQADSLNFRLSHHYTNNFNFRVKADTIALTPHIDTSADTVYLYKGDVIAVADIHTTSDTVFVKVARDQHTMGWLAEPRLLSGTTPDDPISIIIDRLATTRLIWMPVMAILGILLIFSKKSSRLLHPTLDPLCPCLCIMLVATIACLYTSIQMWVPEFWQEYYFHPTLNPLRLPPLMATLVVLVWLIIVAFVAMALEVYKHLEFPGGLLYLLQVCGLSVLAYLAISYSTLIYVGYILLPALLLLLSYIIIKPIKHNYKPLNQDSL